MQKTINNIHKFYFSDKLKKQLSQISQYPLTIIKAPSGFGKTTAVREYIRNELHQSTCEWYTCIGESAPVAWMNICELFAKINSEMADGMKNLKMPTIDTLYCMTAYLKNLGCKRKTYLVIDNYQLINFDMHRELINVFSVHEDPNLHIIFITQLLDSRQQLSVHNNSICTIDSSAFFFDRVGISKLFRMEGMKLTEDEIEKIYKNTEGWISAIRLQMINYKKTGSFVCSAGIEQLVETAVWNRLGPKEKDFLLTVSVFDSFTAQQVVDMLDYESTPGKIEVFLKNSDFIRFLPGKRLFTIHSILLDYIRNRFYCHQPKEYQNQIFRKAGMACTAMNKYCLAAVFFYRIKDFNAILSLPFTHQYLVSQEECEGKLFVTIAQECPEEILSKYPSAMVAFGHYALLNGQYEIYKKLCGLLRSLAKKKTNLSQEEIRRLNGKLVLLESLGEFNDLVAMRDGYMKAGGIVEDQSDLVEKTTPWLSIFPTTIGMFWRETGKLDQSLSIIDEIKPIYRKYSQGQGSGLSHLMRAEVLLSRGEDNEAEIYCHKSLYEASAYQQISIRIYAELCLARIYILRGDAENFSIAMGNIQKYSEEYSDVSIRRMVDMCLSMISLFLGVKDYVAPWLYNIEGIRKFLYTPVIPFAEVFHSRLLLIDKRYNELYAISQIALEANRNPDTKIQYLLPRLYHLIFLAVAKYNNGDDLEAQEYLKEALSIALPDRVYLPFADHDCIIELLLRQNHFYGEISAFADLMKLCKRQQKGVNMIRKVQLRNKSPLTPREREIALLAKERMSAKEIADQLCISEATVKSTLRSVYSKLEVHSKNELARVEF